MLSAEKSRREDLRRWGKDVKLIQAYGPTEVTACTTWNLQYRETEVDDIGGDLWLVEPENRDKLVPVGCIGELVISGPVARGYLNKPELTAEKFYEPVFARSRAYRSGDLCRLIMKAVFISLVAMMGR